VNTAPKLPSVPTVAGVRLTPLLGAGGAGRSVSRRRAAFGVALLVVAVLAVLVATGRIRAPKIRLLGAGFATAVSARQAPSRAATAEVETARAQARATAAPRASEARPASDRVVAATHAAALFAQHSWYVAPPPPPPAAPPPPPEPTAPPFPYTLVGSYAPEGDAPVFFLARGDRVIDARVGDKLDGVYRFESAAGGQLVFVYLPLDIHQNLAVGASR
jgi:hypothetical protein